MPPGSPFKFLTNNRWKNAWWATLTFKILVGLFMPFFSDEAYYWVWAKNLKLSYFDHPPMTAWLFWLSQPLDNFLFSSRLLFVFLSHLTIWIWCQYLARNLSEKDKFNLFWLLFLHPLIGLGGLVANPDIPFLFFWTLSLFFYQKSLENTESWKWPALLGISLGLGFDSKYLMGLIAPLLILHLLVSSKWRNLKLQHIVIPIFLGFAFSLPVWLWNYQNDWASFKFQLHHGLGQTVWKPKWTLDFLLGTFILLFPPFVIYYFRTLKFHWRQLHSLLFLGLLIFFLYTTTKGDTELNWPLALYPSFLLLVSPLINQKVSNIVYRCFFGFLCCLLLAFIFLNPQKSLHPRLQEGALYKELYSSTLNYRPLYTNTYQAASYFYFLSKTPFYKLRYSSRPDEYDSMKESQPEVDNFYFIKEKYQYIHPYQLEIFVFTKIKDLSYGFELYRAERKK